MKLIVGIGNPGKKYLFTRHNVGFIILDRFAKKNNLVFQPSKYDFYQTDGVFDFIRFFLIKPTTYVNNSGLAIVDFLTNTPIETEDILLVHDDINLETGRVKIKKTGSSGGHNGIESVIYHLQNDQFPRLRFGIGNDFGKGDMANYVLDKFDEKDNEVLNSGIEFSVEMIENFVKNGYKGMADFYSKSLKPKKEDNLTSENE